VIQPVETPSAPDAAKQASPSSSPSGASAKAFADVHAAALKDATTGGETPASARIDTPEGETWAATAPGAHYARITGGPRTGQYINLTHGDRRGQTFTIEKVDGKTMHVYGEGDTKVQVSSKADSSAVSNAAKHARHRPSDQPRAGERWAPVEGHSNYADILEGPRNGLYVNISGGIRDGMAFQIVKKGSKVFHVYGTGKDRQMIQVGPKHDTKKADTATSASNAPEGTGTGSTGGTPAG
jgi:hypothetical protein